MASKDGWLAGNVDLETFSFPTFYAACKIRFASMGPDDIARYQVRKARNVVRYAVRHAPFFARLYRDSDLSDVWSLPSVDKRAMMQHLSEYNTLGLARDEILEFCLRVERTRDFSLRLKGVTVGMSSGTSGNKSVEITTRREETYLRAAFFARFPFPRCRVNMAFILRVSSPAFRLRLFGHRLTYISQLDVLEVVCSQLRLLRPNVLAAPPSMLRILARQVERGHLSLDLAQVVSYAEVLGADEKAYLRQVFGCPVYEIYKATEGSIAISCRHGSLHVNEDLVALELLDVAGRPVPPGVGSQRLLVTDLHKTSQPIVRYELNDVVTISPHPCPCGSAFRVIEQIQGRADDVFWGVRSDSGEMQYIFPDYIRRAIVVVSDQIQEYQAIQVSPEEVLVRVEVRDRAEQERIADAVVKGIQQVFLRYNCRPPRVEVAFAMPEPDPSSAKLIRIRRAFAVDI